MYHYNQQLTFKSIDLCGYQFHSKPSPPGQTSGTRLEGDKNPPPRQSLCTKTPPQDKTGNQKPHPRDIKSENSDAIFVFSS